MRVLSLVANNVRMERTEQGRPNICVPGAALFMFLCVEEGDAERDVLETVNRMMSFLNTERPSELPNEIVWPLNRSVILPFAHLSEYASRDSSHIETMLKKIELRMKERTEVFVIGTEATKALFVDLALFDSLITSKLTITKQSIVQHLKALLRVFSVGTLQQALDEAKGGSPNE